MQHPETWQAPLPEIWVENQNFWWCMSAQQHATCCKDLGSRLTSGWLLGTVPSPAGPPAPRSREHFAAQPHAPTSSPLKLLFLIFSFASSALRDPGA